MFDLMLSGDIIRCINSIKRLLQPICTRFYALVFYKYLREIKKNFRWSVT